MRSLVFKMLVLAVTVALCQSACGERTLEELDWFSDGADTIQSGDQFTLKPTAFEPAEMAGDELDRRTFSFKGTRTSDSVGLEVQLRAALVMGEEGSSLTETQFGDTVMWPQDSAAMVLEMEWAVLPFGGTYGGEGYLYFYLTDLENNCLSNILAWPIKFK